MSILTDITSSFYSAAFYRDVAHNRRGIGMKFVALLTVIATLLYTGYFLFYADTLNRLAAEIPSFAQTLPSVVIKDGKLSIDKASPFAIPLGKEEGGVSIVVDTKYKVGDLKALREHMEKNKIIALITEEEAISLKRNNSTLEVFSFKELGQDVTITHADWKNLAEFIAERGVRVLIIAVFIASLIGLFVYNFAAAFFGGVVVWLVAMIVRAKLEFGTCMRVMAALRMPYCAVTAAPLMLGGSFVTGLAAWLVWIGYVVFAVNSTKRGLAAG